MSGTGWTRRSWKPPCCWSCRAAASDPAIVALPIALATVTRLLAGGLWGLVAGRVGRRWSMTMPAAIGIFLTPFCRLTASCSVITAALFLGAIDGQDPSYLAEGFLTAVRATAARFCYHQGAIWGGLVAPVVAAFATRQPSGFAMPVLAGTIGAALVFLIALRLGPQTRGKVLVAGITLAVEAR